MTKLGGMMNKIEENLRLLSIFNYVLAGIIALFSCIPVVHIILGFVFILAPEKMCEGGSCNDLPPQLFGWIFVGIGAFVILVGWAFAVLVFLNGRFLASRTHLKFCIAVSAASCLFMPFGTVLGVFTLLTITKPEAEALFASTPTRLTRVSIVSLSFRASSF